MDFHFATAWELIADTIGHKPAVVCDGQTLSWRAFDDRAARLAAVYSAHDLGVDAKVGTYLHNRGEYLEAQYAAFKIGGCPINVNYRYKADELVYLLDNADVEAVVFQACYAERLSAIRHRLPKVKLYIQVNDGTAAPLNDTLDYASAIGAATPMARIDRDPSSIYMLYTGGTTGLPKGVMYQGGPFCQALMGMGAIGRELPPPGCLAEVPALIEAIGEAAPISLPACPLMHGTGVWIGAFAPLSVGGAVVLSPRPGLDADHLWELVQRHRVTDLVIVGDAFARPLLAALDEAARLGNPYDLASLRQIISSGVMWSTENKQGLLKHHDMALVDVIGSSEGGMGSNVTTREASSETAKFVLNEGVKVFTDDGREVRPGSGEMGMIAASGSVPVGYYKDAEKSAATFREIDGVRYSFPGDFATIAADGTIRLLGRGSACINTAGEKVFPEEVEEAIKRHPEITDSLVVGIPDEHFGERVVAVASRSRANTLAEADLIDFTREQLAGYKVPKQVLFVDSVQRAPNGKADYKWAKRTALTALGIAE